MSVVVQCHLCLSELGLAMHTPTVAANSALAALRLIQENGNENGNKEPVQCVSITFLYIHTCIHEHNCSTAGCAYVHMYTCAHVHTHVHMYVHMYTWC